MAPKIFGIEHIIYMVITFVLMIVGLILIGKFSKSEKSKKLVVRISGAVLLLTIVINRIFCTIFWKGEPFMPSSFCGLASLVFGLALLICKKDSKVFHFIAYSALLGGLITTLYPTYIGQGAAWGDNSLFCPPTITSLLHHSLDIYCAIMLFVTGWIKPNLKYWLVWPIGYAFAMCYGLVMIQFFNKPGAMNINTSLISGTTLNWFYVGLMFLALYTIFLLVYDIITKKKNCMVCEFYGKVKLKFTKHKGKVEDIGQEPKEDVSNE